MYGCKHPEVCAPPYTWGKLRRPDTDLPGHRRAFVQFGNVEEAAAFVKDHYPRVALMLSQSTDDVPDGTFTAYLHYARGRDDSDARAPKSENWSCPEVEWSRPDKSTSQTAHIL